MVPAPTSVFVVTLEAVADVTTEVSPSDDVAPWFASPVVASTYPLVPVNVAASSMDAVDDDDPLSPVDDVVAWMDANDVDPLTPVDDDVVLVVVVVVVVVIVSFPTVVVSVPTWVEETDSASADVFFVVVAAISACLQCNKISVCRYI